MKEKFFRAATGTSRLRLLHLNQPQKKRRPDAEQASYFLFPAPYSLSFQYFAYKISVFNILPLGSPSKSLIPETLPKIIVGGPPSLEAPKAGYQKALKCELDHRKALRAVNICCAGRI
jgi:hypothetical protein